MEETQSNQVVLKLSEESLLLHRASILFSGHILDSLYDHLPLTLMAFQVLTALVLVTLFYFSQGFYLL